MAEGGRENGKYGRFLDHPSLESAIVELATSQHAVIALAQLTEIGISATSVHKRARAGRLHRIYQAVYALVPGPLLTREGRWMAAVLACGLGAALSHRTAAALQELRRSDRANIDVTVPRRATRRHARIDVHRSTTLGPQDITMVNGIPCTTVARTLIDLAEVVNHRALERAFDQAEIIGVLNLLTVNDQLERNPTRVGACRVRAVLNEHYIGSTATQSELEEAFLALSRRTGVADPEVNQWIDLGDGEPMIWADFVWREQRVIVETDGRKFHDTHQARERDPRRDQRALLAGWQPVRTTWRQVLHRPHELEPTIVALLGQ